MILFWQNGMKSNRLSEKALAALRVSAAVPSEVPGMSLKETKSICKNLSEF